MVGNFAAAAAADKAAVVDMAVAVDMGAGSLVLRPGLLVFRLKLRAGCEDCLELD